MLYYHALYNFTKSLSDYVNFTSKNDLINEIINNGEYIDNYIIIFTETEIE